MELRLGWGLAPSLVVVMAVGCASSKDPPAPAGPQCATLAVDRFKELAIVDESVVNDARARNDVEGPWSFHHAIKAMAPTGADAGAFVQKWLQTFSRPNAVNLHPVAARPMTESEVTCPWLRQTPENQCDASCATCAARKLDLAKAPFRLIAITYRPDLPVEAGNWVNGEGRLVFVFTDGPGDDPSAVARDFTIIFEYRLPSSDGRDKKFWARKWHALGAFASLDESYRAALQSVTDAFVARGAGDPGSQNGSSINQVRTNERVMDWGWQMREYRLDQGSPDLTVSPLAQTPARSLDDSPDLLAFVSANKEKILKDEHLVPIGMRSGEATPEKWRLAGVDIETRKAFAKNTCNGCHAEFDPIDTNFQLSPHRKGIDKLSKFMNNPADSKNDDLGKREKYLSDTICEPVAKP